MKRKGKTYMLNKSALVLEGITLAQMVELVVEVLVDFAGSAVFDQKTAEDAEAAHPHDLAVWWYSHQHASFHRKSIFRIVIDPPRPPIDSMSLSSEG